MAAAGTPKVRPVKAGHLNLFDVPEMLPGARPNANPAQREEFERRSRLLHEQSLADEQERAQEVRVNSGSQLTVSELEAMFPNLEADLIRSLLADAPTPQHAVETLLALSAATADPGTEGPRAATPPPRNVGVEDHELFPSLTDANGWQVGTDKQFERDPDEELGSQWRDRAKAAKDMPAPKATWASALAPKRRSTKKEEEDPDDLEPDVITDYEARHRAGQRRAKYKVQYGRGSGRGSSGGRGGGAARGYAGRAPPGAGAAADGSESEASVDVDAI
eukprot:TRINITY_DN52639_c0_g1_i1.p1 TRINITY_DN52639_c0_g1~~TRINITY_DN52639_c0_g1_i1.p1  ORF type:complete len:277 (+),score=80.34 TRINITY_DN52639_c0_g1_i1:110-940(+)